jgi:hypothetical protein
MGGVRGSELTVLESVKGVKKEVGETTIIKNVQESCFLITSFHLMVSLELRILSLTFYMYFTIWIFVFSLLRPDITFLIHSEEENRFKQTPRMPSF